MWFFQAGILYKIQLQNHTSRQVATLTQPITIYVDRQIELTENFDRLPYRKLLNRTLKTLEEQGSLLQCTGYCNISRNEEANKLDRR